jgi:hypothetical protein
LVEDVGAREQEFTVQFYHLHDLDGDIGCDDIFDADAGGGLAAFGEELGEFAALDDGGGGVFLLEEAEAGDKEAEVGY